MECFGCRRTIGAPTGEMDTDDGPRPLCADCFRLLNVERAKMGAPPLPRFGENRSRWRWPRI